MGLGKINKLLQGYIEKMHPRDNTVVNTDAATKIQRYFAELDVPVGNITDNTTIEDLLDTAKNAHQQIEARGQKPSMGLEAPEVVKAENNLEKVEQTAQQNVQQAEGSLEQATSDAKVNSQNAQEAVTDSTQAAEANNNVAEQAVSEAQSNAEANNTEAQEQVKNAQTEAETKNTEAEENLDKVKNDTQAKIDTAQADLDNATEVQATAQSSFDEAQNSVNTAQTTLANAQAALSQAKTDEEKQAAQQQVNSAQEALNAAKENLELKKQELNSANQALDTAKTNLEQVKNEGETAVNQAEQNVQDVKIQGDEAVQQAQQNESDVKKQGEQAVKESEQNVSDVKKQGEQSVKQAEQNVQEVKTQNEQAVQSAENQVKVTEAESDKKVNDAQEVVETQQDKVQQEIPKPEEIAQTVIDMARGYNNEGKKVKYNEEEYNKALNSINSDNIDDVIRAGGEDFTDAVTGTLTNDKKENIVKKDVIKRAEADTKRLVQLMNEAQEKYQNYQHPTVNTDFGELGDNLAWEMDELNSGAENFDVYKEAMSGNLLHAANNIGAMNDYIDTINEKIKINGKIDERSRQLTGNCWLHAGIESLARTPEGQRIIASNISRDPASGITTVTIPESGKAYQITDSELVTMNAQSIGDPDMEAYAIAINRYLQETEGINAGEGNTSTRLYEIMTGSLNQDITINNGQFSSGVSSDPLLGFRSDDARGEVFDAAYNLVSSNGGSCTLGVRLEFGERHALSIVGTDAQGRLVVEESNNDESIARYVAGEGNYDMQRGQDGRMRYQMHIDRERFQKIAIGLGVWKA